MLLIKRIRKKYIFQLSGIIVLIFFFYSNYSVYHIVSQSMENTLLVGDYILIKKLKRKSLKYGDIGVFKSFRHMRNFTKRVIGLPGDTIEIQDYKVYRNSKLIPYKNNSAYSIDFFQSEDGKRASSKVEFKNKRFIISQDSLFVVGDNIKDSYDSRYFGPIPSKISYGKVEIVIFNYYNGKHQWSRILKKVD
ncbi:MAG: signal peptidase I [Draconibacterium sp.]